jgi:hypothetical protein
VSGSQMGGVRAVGLHLFIGEGVGHAANLR